MALELRVPRYSYDDLRRRAADFLQTHNPHRKIPVPIEEIAEFDLGLNIIPVPGLQRFDVDGFISSDFTTITVDQDILERHVTRYRFTLAHEIAHLVLHRHVFAELRISGIEEWMGAMEEIAEEDYRWLEYQAYAFAGLVLVPGGDLKAQFHNADQKAREHGLKLEIVGDVGLQYICKSLGQYFLVSAAVVEKRLRKDNLYTQP